MPGSHDVVRGWANANADVDDQQKVFSPSCSSQIFLPKEDPLKLHAQKAPVRAGHILIWNSKLVHCNYPNNSNHMRMVQYIQMKRADDPAKGCLFTDENLLPTTQDFQLTTLGRKLYGFDLWD